MFYLSSTKKRTCGLVTSMSSTPCGREYPDVRTIKCPLRCLYITYNLQYNCNRVRFLTFPFNFYPFPFISLSFPVFSLCLHPFSLYLILTSSFSSSLALSPCLSVSLGEQLEWLVMCIMHLHPLPSSPASAEIQPSLYPCSHGEQDHSTNVHISRTRRAPFELRQISMQPETALQNCNFSKK